jgi:hypothetical protein
MTKRRQTVALGPPPLDLSGFPRWRLRPGYALRRAHQADRSPWWFASDLSGRFDLVDPHGTCYLATDLITALREKFGHELVEQGVITFEAAARTSISTLGMPAGRWLADTCHVDAARYGLTREIGTCPDYGIPQAWAAAFLEGRLGGVRYQTRFTTGARPNAVALFDVAGSHDWPTDPAPLGGVQACGEAGITVARRPLRTELRVHQPPTG